MRVSCVKRIGLYLVLACALLVTSTSEGQMNQPRMKFAGFPSSLQVQAYEPSEYPQFAILFDRSPQHKSLQAESFVLTNNDGRSMIGIGLRWTLTYQKGTTKQYTVSSHSFLLPSAKAIAQPHGHVLVSADSVAPETVFTSSSGVIGTVPSEAVINAIKGASEILVLCDSVIYEDGEVFGPDSLLLVDNIETRQSATISLRRAIESARANGQDPIQAIRMLVIEHRSRSDKVSRYEGHLASAILNSRNPNAALSLLDSDKAPPRFYRKDAKK
jgi:hypothetical protein